MQEASIQGLWFIVILILGYYAFKWLARVFLPIMMQKAVRNFEKKPGSKSRFIYYSSAINGYLKSVGGTKFSLIVLGETQRYRFNTEPALSLVPEPLAPPNGC